MNRAVYLVAALATLALRAAPGIAQERAETYWNLLGKPEMERRLRVRERLEQDRIRKASVNQDDYDAIYYEIVLDIDPASERIAGTTTATVESKTGALSSVVLDLLDQMTVSEVREGGVPVSFTHSQDLLTINLANTYAQGQTVDIAIDYSGAPSVLNEELFADVFTWGEHGGNGQKVIFTLSEPTFARAWWPCKDVLDDKATVRLKATVPDTLVVASNGRKISEINLGNGKIQYDWWEEYPISTYLVSLAISNYEVFSDYYHNAPNDSMEVTYFVYPEDLADAQVDFAVTVPMIEFFAGLFGEYPFINEKYGMAEINFGGAMEHQTCTSYGSFFVRGNNSYDWIVAHELSHQWWGDMVGPATWADVWLNEGFAAYCEALWEEHVNGPDAYRSYIAIRRLSRGFSGTLYNPDVLFDGPNVYWRGSWVLHMLRHVMGDGDFFTALRNYGSAFGFVNATTKDFQTVCEGVYGSSLAWFFDQWVFGWSEPSYEYYWAQQPYGGMSEVNLTIRQTQTTGIITMPIDIRFALASGDSTVSVWNNTPVQQYSFTMPVNVTAVSVDPDEWILRTVDEQPLSAAANLTVSPNPFNATTTIAFEAATGGAFKVEIFDATGARIATLLNDTLPSGFHIVEWQGRNAAGQGVASGVYFVRLASPQGEVVRKAVLLK